MVLVNRGLASWKLGDDFFGCCCFEYDCATLFGDQGVIFVKNARVLCNWIELATKRRPCLAISGMCMCSTNYFWSSFVDCGVQYKRCFVDGLIAVHNIAIVIDQDQIACLHVAETFTERVDPKVIGEFWVACSDVACHTFAISKATKHAKRCG